MNTRPREPLSETENQAEGWAVATPISQKRTADTISVDEKIVVHAEIVTEILRISDYTFHVYEGNSSYGDFIRLFSSDNKNPKSWEGRLTFQKDKSNKDKNAKPETVSVRVKICLCYPGETLCVVARKCD